MIQGLQGCVLEADFCSRHVLKTISYPVLVQGKETITVAYSTDLLTSKLYCACSYTGLFTESSFGFFLKNQHSFPKNRALLIICALYKLMSEQMYTLFPDSQGRLSPKRQTAELKTVADTGESLL